MSVVKTLEKKIADQGKIVRDLEAAKAEKAAITAEVAKLLDLKKQLGAAQAEDRLKRMSAVESNYIQSFF